MPGRFQAQTAGLCVAIASHLLYSDQGRIDNPACVSTSFKAPNQELQTIKFKIRASTVAIIRISLAGIQSVVLNAVSVKWALKNYKLERTEGPLGSVIDGFLVRHTWSMMLGSNLLWDHQEQEYFQWVHCPNPGRLSLPEVPCPAIDLSQHLKRVKTPCARSKDSGGTVVIWSRIDSVTVSWSC